MKYQKILTSLIIGCFSLAPKIEETQQIKKQSKEAKKAQAPKETLKGKKGPGTQIFMPKVPKKPRVRLYEEIRDLSLSLSKEANWSRCLKKFMCSSNFNASGEIGWENSSSANKITQTYVCNINADSLFYLITGKSAKRSIMDINIDSTQDSPQMIMNKILEVFKKSKNKMIHHVILLVDQVPHYFLILQEESSVSLLQSYSTRLPNKPNTLCSYSLSDYLTKSAEELYGNIILEKTSSTRKSLLPIIKENNLLHIVRDYINNKTVPLSYITNDINNLFTKAPKLLSNSYLRLFVCPLPNFFEEDYFTKKGTHPRIWMNIKSRIITDENLTFFRESLKGKPCSS